MKDLKLFPENAQHSQQKPFFPFVLTIVNFTISFEHLSEYEYLVATSAFPQNDTSDDIDFTVHKNQDPKNACFGELHVVRDDLGIQ